MEHHYLNKHFSEIFSQGNRLCRAFTLAEVLITLGIIGVVAAMTMPALVSHHQKMVFKNQYKKLYSTLYQAYNKSVYDVGGITDCYHEDINTGVHGNWTDKPLAKIFVKQWKKIF